MRDTRTAIKAAHERGAQLDGLRARSDIPPGFEDVLLKMLDADPKRRFANAADVEQALHKFSEISRQGTDSNYSVVSLADWRSQIKISAVCTGDRSELPPHTSADLLARSASMGDLTYFCDLGIQARFRSHKIIKISEPDGQRRAFGGDVLIVGSPAVNLMTRLANRSACFQFALTAESLRLEERFERELEDIKFNRIALEAYVNPKTSADAERIRDLNKMHKSFAQGRFIDPIECTETRGERNPYCDYGVVTLCQNPVDESGVAILAGGTGGPATAASLKLLADPDAFLDHPLGGVFRVGVSTEAGWHDRYDWLDPKWETPPYTVAGYRRCVEQLTERDKRGSFPSLEFAFSEEGANRILKLLELLKRRREALRSA